MQGRAPGVNTPLLTIAEKIVLIYWHIYPPVTRKRRCAVRARLGVAGHLSTTLRWGIPLSAFSKGTTSKLADLFHTVLLMLNVKQEAVNTNFQVIRLTRLVIKLQVYRSRSRRSIHSAT